MGSPKTALKDDLKDWIKEGEFKFSGGKDHYDSGDDSKETKRDQTFGFSIKPTFDGQDFGAKISISASAKFSTTARASLSASYSCKPSGGGSGSISGESSDVSLTANIVAGDKFFTITQNLGGSTSASAGIIVKFN